MVFFAFAEELKLQNSSGLILHSIVHSARQVQHRQSGDFVKVSRPHFGQITERPTFIAAIDFTITEKA